MVKLLLRLFAPRTPWQFVLGFAFWIVAFELVFLSALTLVGLRFSAPLWQFLVVGVVSIAPFLVISLAMLQVHLQMQQRLKRAARTDALTNLPNRRAFVEHAEQHLDEMGTAFLVMIDVDNFKKINDTYGHGFGDICLKRLAELMQPVMPHGYHLARLGGEEFGILVTHGKAEQVRQIGKRIARGTSVELPDGAGVLHITNSLGAAVAGHGDQLSELMSRADHALYEAKANGRARFVWSSNDPVPKPLAELPRLTG